MLLVILPIPEAAELFSPHPNHCAALLDGIFTPTAIFNAQIMDIFRPTALNMQWHVQAYSVKFLIICKLWASSGYSVKLIF